MPIKQPNWRSQAGNSSMNNISAAPSSALSNKGTGCKLDPPPFVSPGQKKSPAKWMINGPMSPPPFSRKSGTSGVACHSQPTSTFLGKPAVTPEQPAKSKVGPTALTGSNGLGGLHMSPSPSQVSKAKAGAGKSWKDNISFQATSPGVLKKSATSIKPPTYYGGSYIDKGKDSSSSPTKKNKKDGGPSGSSSEEVAPDIKIHVNIDIQEKIKARRAAAKPIPPKQENVPEHIRKAREREERRKRANEEKEYRSASLVQAAVLGWYARVQYPRMLAANQDRLREIRKREAMAKIEQRAAIKIQSIFRMHMPRKRYVYVIGCKRRRERNQKEIKKIEKTIEKLPKKTKADLKEMKNEYAEKKKDLKRSLRKQVKEDDEKMLEIKKSGQDMIEYVKGENEKLKQQQLAIKAEQKVLEKQFELLTEKSEEIAKNFKSLQEWVEKKNTAIQKHEMSDQKCRHRYLPKYRGTY